MKTASLVLSALLTCIAPLAAAETSLLFIGNSFTFGWGSSVRYYRSDSVRDLNGEGTGGVPALFKSFADQMGLQYRVSLETVGGSDIQFHLDNKLPLISSEPWDQVVMHGYSTLDPQNPGNPDALVSQVAKMAAVLRDKQQDVAIYLTATWPRADQVYLPERRWSGQSVQRMASDIRKGYDLAADASGADAVNGVGEAWIRAMQSGIADSNPYNGIELNKVDLWTYDHYHASSYGYYLEALVVFGNLTGVDPRALGANECSGFELGMSPRQIQMLQQAAFDQLLSDGRMKPQTPKQDQSRFAARCASVIDD
ncbi:SGNH/GDSL hydrolase family protein [Congregibacter variabilis]|uniref:SGNH/GDSL hydrolase family protein n=1 Tax=Congregibacter variabilis TaxID=3081200 RepID=A0ABZ0I7L4_9GAMM|nr:SGNH/GDSL hydrolase family protein [Congregibacter sp. IMCC43200]